MPPAGRRDEARRRPVLDHTVTACTFRPDIGDPALLVAAARRVLDRNWLGTSTVPSRSLYPHQWSWDSAFIAVGRSWDEQERAQHELESLFAAQWADGMVPHIVFNPDVPPDSYFPGPDFWQSERASRCPGHARTSGITQPPLHARAALEVHEHAADPEASLAFLRRLYPGLVAQHDHLRSARDVTGDGLVSIVHPWESGLDNSPAWDRALADLVVPDGAVPAYERRDLVHADPADRPSDDAYDRFVYLAVTYRDAGYDDSTLLATSPFLLEDPLFNAIHLWSLLALADIAELVGDDPTPHRRAARRVHDALLDHLWSPGQGRFCVRDARSGRLDPEIAIQSFVPLLDPDLPPEVRDALVATLDTPHFHPSQTGEHFLLPSFDLADTAFDPRRYWRGPVWLNTNWLVWRGLREHGEVDLAAELAAGMAAMVERSGCREYFAPADGAGYGSTDFSWSAALVIDRLRRDPPEGAA